MFKNNQNIKEIKRENKITFRARSYISSSEHNLLIENIEKSEYRLFEHKNKKIKSENNTFTVVLVAHGNNIKYFRESIESVLNQDDDDCELVLIDHGCEVELGLVIIGYFLNHNNIKLLIYKENIFENQVESYYKNRFTEVINSGLFCSEGRYVTFLSYDDFLSANYIKSMRNLFNNNVDCKVACPSVVSISKDSNINIEMTSELKKMNSRPRYINGLDLAKSVINNENLFNPPGTLCCFESDVVLSNGGWDLMIDRTQIFKFSILTTVGTSEDATLYWRHHDDQTNKKYKRVGMLWNKMFNDWKIAMYRYNLQNNLSNEYQKTFKIWIEELIHEHTKNDIKDSIRYGFKSSIKVLNEIILSSPKYIPFYILYLAVNLHYFIYNSLPENIKNKYRAIKK